MHNSRRRCPSRLPWVGCTRDRRLSKPTNCAGLQGKINVSPPLGFLPFLLPGTRLVISAFPSPGLARGVRNNELEFVGGGWATVLRERPEAAFTSLFVDRAGACQQVGNPPPPGCGPVLFRGPLSHTPRPDANAGGCLAVTYPQPKGSVSPVLFNVSVRVSTVQHSRWCWEQQASHFLRQN